MRGDSFERRKKTEARRRRKNDGRRLLKENIFKNTDLKKTTFSNRRIQNTFGTALTPTTGSLISRRGPGCKNSAPPIAS